MIGGLHASLARGGNSAYLEFMAQPIPAQNEMLSATQPKARVASVIVWSAALLGALALAAAAVLWIYYGTTVFFELIAAGIAACF